LTVDVQSAAGGSGTVNLTPPNVDCVNVPGSPRTCQSSYPIGAVVQLTATPSVDSIFVGWTLGACTGTTPSCSVTMDEAKAVQATFRGRTLVLSVVSEQNGVGSVSVEPPGALCTGAAGITQTCEYRYAAGASVTLAALPSIDMVFVGWSGGSCSGTSPTCDLTIGDVNLVTAVFRGPEVLTLNVQSGDDGSGSLQIFPYGNPCAVAPGGSQVCTHVFPRGTLITLLPHADPGSAFDGWSGPCTGSSSVCQFVLDQATTATAVFRRTQTLSVTITGTPGVQAQVFVQPGGPFCELRNGEPAVTCTADYAVGTVVTPTAYVAGGGTIFLGWTGCAPVPGTESCTVTVGGPTAIVAAFRTNQLPNPVVNGPWDADRGEPVTFDGTGSTDPDGDPLTYHWDFGDGSTADGPIVTHTYAIGGTYQVLLEVNDGFRVTSAGENATIHNRGPVANAGGPYTGFRGEPVTLDGTASTDPEGDPITYRWDFGDGGGWTGTGPTPTHVYSAFGTYPVTLTIDDGGGPSEPSIAYVVIVDRPPIAVPGGPYTAAHGAPVTFDGSGSYDPDGGPITLYHWMFGDGQDEFGQDAHPTHVYAIGGTFVVTLHVYDNGAEYGEASTTVTIANQRPIARPGGPYTGTRRDTITFNGTGSSDPDGDPLTYVWDFGIFGGGAGPIEQAAFGELGTFAVTLVVSDGAVSSLPVSTTVTIVNILPTVSAGGPYTGVRGDSVQFYGTADDQDFDPLTYSWTFGDGGTGTGANPNHVYTTFGTFTARLTVSDGHGTSVATTTVAIANQPPVANVGGPYSGTRGVNIAFTGSGTDPDGDPLTYRWNFGDGGTAMGRTPTHKYTTFGTFVVTLVVNDGRADSAPSTTQATVPDRRPIANANGPYTAYRGVAITFNGAGSLDPDGNPLTYLWNFGDGTTGTGKNPTHAYATVGTFTARLVVSDGGPQPSLESTAAVTISNRAPVARTGGPYTGKRALAVQFNGSTSSDPDGDPLTYAWTFGDGSTGTGASPTHVYATLGTFTVTLQVNDGLVTSPAATTTATITNAAPIANAGADRTVVRLTAVTLDGRASSDPDGTITAWSWRQLSGPSVSLGAANTSQPRFTAPNVNNTTALNFELKVTDNNGATAIDTVKITVVR
jgi:PKD repeat protein